jgi:adhesin transport system outer membrane protein
LRTIGVWFFDYMKFLMFFVLLALAQSGASAAGWTFQEILQATLASHPQIMGKSAELAAARADKVGAEWQRYPTPSIDATASSDGGHAGLLRLDQPLWTGGRISSGIDLASGRLGVAEAGVDESRLDLVLRVIAASAESVRQQARLRLGQASVAEHERLLAMMRRRVQQEVSPLADQRLAESRLHAVMNEASTATLGLDNALVQLGQLSGEMVRAFDAESFEKVAAEGEPFASLESLLEQVLGNSPTLKRLRFEAESAQAEIAARRSVYQPKLSFRLESSTGTVTDKRALLVLSAQPGAGLSAKSGIDAALARRDAALQAIAAVERQLREIATLSWNEWRTARDRFPNAEEAMALSLEVSNSYARQFVAGRKSWLDVLNAAREATQAELALVDVRSQIQLNALRLRGLLGEIGRFSVVASGDE